MCWKHLVIGCWLPLLVLLGTDRVFASECRDPLVGHWKLDEASGSVALDSSLHGNHGTIIGGPQKTEGILGRALDFRVIGSYIDCGNPPHFDLREELMLALWLKIHHTEPKQYHPYLSKGLSYGIRQHYSHALEFYINDAKTVSVLHPLAQQVGFDEWQHVAGMYDGKKLDLYINGEWAAQTSYSGLINTSHAPVTIAHNSAYPNRICNAVIDDVRIYDRADELIFRPRPYIPGFYPDSQERDVLRDVVLSWPASAYDEAFNVFFGTDCEAVRCADINDPGSILVSYEQDVNNFDPAGLLEFGQVYYWRVDALRNERVTGPRCRKGYVRSFSVEPFSRPIPCARIHATASSHMPEMGAENICECVGGMDLCQDQTDLTSAWFCAEDDSTPWIQFEFDRPFKLHEMRVWNAGHPIEGFTGSGIRDVSIEMSSDGVTWTALEDPPQFAQGPTSGETVFPAIVDLGGFTARLIRLTVINGWTPQGPYGLSEVRLMYVPTFASRPHPQNGTQVDGIDVELSWRAGRGSAHHEVYLAPSGESLTQVGTTTQTTFNVDSLDYDASYQWRVDEVNASADLVCHQGDVWTFTTPSYCILDDFESYNDECNRIFFYWLDGLGYENCTDCGCDVPDYKGNGTGSIVGNPMAPFAEKTIVHSGRQSMPFYYDNSSAPYYSEVQSRSFYLENDWTRGGVDTLSLFFHGLPAAPSEDPNQVHHPADVLHLAVEDYQNRIKTMVHPDPRAVLVSSWQEWRIPLGEFSAAGIDLSEVKGLIIGVGDPNATEPGGTGTLYIDDIRLSGQRPR